MPKATVWRILPFPHILLRCQDTNVSIQIILHISVILFLYIYFARDQVWHCTADVTFKNSSPTRRLSFESFGFVCRICSYHLCCSRGSLNRKHNQKILHKFLQSFCTAETESKQSFLVLSMQSECKSPWSLTLHYWSTKKKYTSLRAIAIPEIHPQTAAAIHWDMAKTHANFFPSVQHTRKSGVQEILKEIWVTITVLGWDLSCLVKDVCILSDFVDSHHQCHIWRCESIIYPSARLRLKKNFNRLYVPLPCNKSSIYK